MIQIEQTFTTDVLVIGGGGAGVRAALEAEAKGAKTMLATKRKLGVSGTTAFEVAEIAGYNAADGCIETDSPEQHYQDIMQAALGTCDPEVARVLTEEAPESLAELEDWGVPFEKKGDRHLVVEGCFGSQPRMHIIKRHSKPILEVLVARLSSTTVQVLEEAIVVDLVVEDNTCYGALLMDYTGRFMFVRAGAVILATGGGGQLFKLNLNPKDVTADGYAIGLRAGAEIINMEFMQAGLGLVHPLSNILNCWVWYLRPRLLNNRGEEFLAKYLPSGVEPLDCMREKAHHFPFSSRDLSKYIETAIIKEINLGNYGPHGGVYIDFRQIDLSKVSRDFQTMWQTTKCWYKKLGVDPDEELLEVAPFGHAINGGLRVGPNGESTVEKLFAVGEVAGGPHGADRLGGNMILCCQVFGKRAGRAAADASASAGKQGRTPAGSLNLTIKGINAGQGRLNPAQVKKEIQELISANYLVVRNARGLETLIEKAQEIVARMETEGFRITAPSDKVQALECRNMLDVATMMAKAALLREESRGSHYREDFPDPKPEFSKIISFQLCGEKLRHKTIQTN